MKGMVVLKLGVFEKVPVPEWSVCGKETELGKPLQALFRINCLEVRVRSSYEVKSESTEAWASGT